MWRTGSILWATVLSSARRAWRELALAKDAMAHRRRAWVRSSCAPRHRGTWLPATGGTLAAVVFAMTSSAGAAEPPSEHTALESRTSEPPRPRPRLRPSEYRGTGLFIAAGVVGGAALAGRLYFTVPALMDANLHPDPEFDADEIQSSGWVTIGGTVTTPFMAVSLGLLGGASALHGRWRAREDLARRDVDEPRATRRAWIGWSLFGAGVGVWASTRLAARFGCRSELCKLATLEAPFYPSVALAAAGMVIAPHASSYRATLRRARVEGLSVAPTLDRSSVGVTVSGPF